MLWSRFLNDTIKKATQKIRGFQLNKNHSVVRQMKGTSSSATNSNAVEYPHPHMRLHIFLDLLPELD